VTLVTGLREVRHIRSQMESSVEGSKTPLAKQRVLNHIEP
jgi:hypothetical protein